MAVPSDPQDSAGDAVNQVKAGAATPAFLLLDLAFRSVLAPLPQRVRKARPPCEDEVRVGGWRDRVADAMDGFRRTWQPTDLRCGVPDGRSASDGAPQGESAPLGEPAPPSLRDTVQTARECVGDRRGGGRGKSR